MTEITIVSGEFTNFHNSKWINNQASKGFSPIIYQISRKNRTIRDALKGNKYGSRIYNLSSSPQCSIFNSSSTVGPCCKWCNCSPTTTIQSGGISGSMATTLLSKSAYWLQFEGSINYNGF